MEQARKQRAAFRFAARCFKLANAGNVAAAIFLSKNLLGYRDVVQQRTSAARRGAQSRSQRKPDLSQLTDEELEQLRSHC